LELEVKGKCPQDQQQFRRKNVGRNCVLGKEAEMERLD
jgi:hypothetical protein